MLEFVHKHNLCIFRQPSVEGKEGSVKLLQSGCERLQGRMLSLSKAKQKFQNFKSLSCLRSSLRGDLPCGSRGCPQEGVPSHRVPEGLTPLSSGRGLGVRQGWGRGNSAWKPKLGETPQWTILLSKKKKEREKKKALGANAVCVLGSLGSN